MHIRQHKANPVDVLKTISRIVLRNFRSIRAYWVTLGTKLAQVALNYGANDLDGTLMGEKVTHAAGAKTPHTLTIANILALIRGANKIAAERDTFYIQYHQGLHITISRLISGIFFVSRASVSWSPVK